MDFSKASSLSRGRGKEGEKEREKTDYMSVGKLSIASTFSEKQVMDSTVKGRCLGIRVTEPSSTFTAISALPSYLCHFPRLQGRFLPLPATAKPHMLVITRLVCSDTDFSSPFLLMKTVLLFF